MQVSPDPQGALNLKNLKTQHIFPNRTQAKHSNLIIYFTCRSVTCTLSSQDPSPTATPPRVITATGVWVWCWGSSMATLMVDISIIAIFSFLSFLSNKKSRLRFTSSSHFFHVVFAYLSVSHLCVYVCL